VQWSTCETIPATAGTAVLQNKWVRRCGIGRVVFSGRDPTAPQLRGACLGRADLPKHMWWGSVWCKQVK